MTRLIDADELRDNMLYAMCGTGYQHVAMREIDFMPTIDAVPVRYGKWLDPETLKRPWFRHHIFECSVCRNILDMDGVNAGRGDANYCPNCGARMKGAGDETD